MCLMQTVHSSCSKGSRSVLNVNEEVRVSFYSHHEVQQFRIDATIHGTLSLEK